MKTKQITFCLPIIIIYYLFMAKHNNWTSEIIMSEWSAVDMSWNHPYPYGLAVDDVMIEPSKFVSTTLIIKSKAYGDNIFFPLQAIDETDYLGRIIYSIITNYDEPYENAPAIAQLIVNRMKKEQISAMRVVQKFEKNKYFFRPSIVNTEGSAYLFIQCCYLEECIIYGNNIPIYRENGDQIWTDIGSRSRYVIMDEFAKENYIKVKEYIIIGDILYY